MRSQHCRQCGRWVPTAPGMMNTPVAHVRMMTSLPPVPCCYRPDMRAVDGVDRDWDLSSDLDREWLEDQERHQRRVHWGSEWTCGL